MLLWLGMAAAAATAPLPEMTVAQFLAAADALRAKGVLALASPELQRLKDEMAGVTAAYRADLARPRPAGTPPHSCPPPKGQTGMTSTDLVSELRAIPPDRRGVTLKSAFYAIMKKRYPCPHAG